MISLSFFLFFFFSFSILALTENSTYIRALTRRAMANEKLNTYESLSLAFKDYEKILELEPHHTESRKKVQILPNLIKIQEEKAKDEMIGK